MWSTPRLLNPYPFSAAGRIMRLAVRDKSSNLELANLNPDQIRQLRRVNTIENALAMDRHDMTMTNHDLPESVNVIGLIANGFDDLGAPAMLG